MLELAYETTCDWWCRIYRKQFYPLLVEKYPQDNIVNLDKLTYAGNLENLKSIEKILITNLFKAIFVTRNSLTR